MSYLRNILKSEIPIANLYSQLGYFTRFHINIYPTESTRQLSDIDVFAIKFDNSLLPYVTLIEVKEESNKFSDLFKLYGFKTFYGDCKAVFVTKKVHERTIPIAKQLQINLLTVSKLKELAEKDESIKIERFTLKSAIQFFNNLDEIKKIDPQLYWTYHYLWLEKDPFRRFYHQQKLFTITNEKISEDFKSPISWYRRELFILSIISLVEIASNCITLDEKILKSYIESKFLNVDVSYDARKKIKTGVDVLIEEIKKMGIEMVFDELEIMPKYVPLIVELINKIIKNSQEIQYYININEYITRLMLKEKEVILADIVENDKIKFIRSLNELVLRILHSGPIKYDFSYFV